jgi:methylated-DNA-[protein]-cysteine S-methyltransferase
MMVAIGGQVGSAIISTKFGWIGMQYSDKGLRKLTLPFTSKDALSGQLRTNNGGTYTMTENLLAETEKQLLEYFAGTRKEFILQLDLSGSTGFQRLVWECAGSIPYGGIRSYGWVAERIGKPLACRAVGQALAANPIPYVIPCHRVISSGGKLGGFGGKANISDFKRKLLLLESALVNAGQARSN